jgi:menaquinone-dependent protoporphyrinogen oxidase
MKMPGIVIYASKYGSTAEYAHLMAQKLGTEALAASEAPLGAVLRAHFVVLGSPIYGYSVLPEMESFLMKNREVLAKKPIAAFVVCGDTLWNPESGEGGNKNLEKLTCFLSSEPFSAAILGGRMRMAELDGQDGPRIKVFYERIGREATGFDRMEMEKVEPFIKEIKSKVVGVK